MSKKLFLVVVIVLSMSVMALMPARAQDTKKWDGADDLPTSPLECGTGGAAMAETTPDAAMAEMTPAAMPAYDGGAVTGAPDLAGKPITLIDVPKLIGIGYFDATAKGMQDAAKELGNVTVKTDGPTDANIDKQIQ